MAFETLDAIRTGKLNPDLGITDDAADEPWGDETVRNAALQNAISRLWPRMARLVRESVAIVTDATEYTLTSIWDLETIEVSNADGQVYNELRNFRSWVDHSADPAVSRVLLPIHWASGVTDTIAAVGYAPHAVPATGAAQVDIPPEHTWIIVTGARAYLYRRRYNQFIDFEQRQVENRDNATSPSELFAMYQDAERLFEQAITTHGRRLQLPKTSRLRRR